jgi:hypothetical protein
VRGFVRAQAEMNQRMMRVAENTSIASCTASYGKPQAQALGKCWAIIGQNTTDKRAKLAITKN